MKKKILLWVIGIYVLIGIILMLYAILNYGTTILSIQWLIANIMLWPIRFIP